MVRDGDTYTVQEYALSLRLNGDRLEGTNFPLNAPIELHRTESLPIEAPIPDLPAGPGPRWVAKLGGSIFAPAAARDGVAYVGSTAGLFYAVRAADGKLLWAFVAGRPIHGEALVTDSHVFFVCDNGDLFKLQRASGQEVWRYDLGDGRVARPGLHQVLDKEGIGEFDADVTAPRPVLADGVIYVGSGDGSFHAVDAASGRRVWRFENASTGKAEGTPWDTQGSAKNRTTAAVDGERVIFGSWDHHVYALERKTGKEMWRKDTKAELTSPPVLVGEKLLIGNRGGLLAALDPASGKTLWRATFWGSSIESTPVPTGEGLFVIGSSDMRRVSLIDARDGRVAWRTDVLGVAWGRPGLDGSRVYASAYEFRPYQMRHVGGLSALDRATGKALWRWPAPECGQALAWGFVAGPVVVDRTVVVGGLDGVLYGFPAE